MSEQEEGWHGWASGDTALFIADMPGDDHCGLYLQQGRDTQLAAVFVDRAMGQMVMDWLDESLQRTGEANTELLERLKRDQPLAFVTPAGTALPDDTDELFAPDDD